MKKILLSAALVLTSIVTANAQAKEGSITYAMTIEGLPEEQAAMMKGMETKVYYKNGKSRAETSMAFGTTTVFTDEKGNSTTLTDMAGQKFFVKQNADDAKKEESKNADPKITYTNDKKTIAGYECKKAVVELKDESGTVNNTDVWYSEKIPYISSSGGGKAQFKGLKGAPLEFEMNQGPMKIKISATEVSMTAVPDSKFVISTEGFTEMKPEDLKKMRGGH